MRQFILLIILTMSISTNVQAKAVLITAATSSFGQEISLNLASEGYDLVLAGRSQTKLDTLKNKILSLYKTSNIQIILLDFSQTEKIKSSIAGASLNQLDGVVLIGPRPQLSKIDIPSANEWLKCFSETFVAPLESLKFLIPHIKDNGSIVVISGSSSKDYLKDYANNNIIRLAWTGEIKNLANFTAARKIRVNAISSGPILTQHHRDNITKAATINNVSFDEQMKKHTATIPLGTYGSLEDIANLVQFLVSKKSAYITGSNILIDGGASHSY